ncbi:MAG: hypothetical protein AAF805_00095 [Planctomycetota bacterium]
MAVTSLHSAGAIVLHSNGMADPLGFAVNDTQQVELNQRTQTLRRFGTAFESAVSATGRAPGISFDTQCLARALDVMGPLGVCVTSGSGSPAATGLDAYFIPHDRCNQRELAAALRYRASDGYLMPTSLQAAHGEVATLSGQAALVADGSGGEPLPEPSLATVPTAVIEADEQFTLYEVRVAGVPLRGVKSVGVEFGIGLSVESADGAVFPEWVSVDTIATRITVTGVNLNWLSQTDIPVGGKRGTHLDTYIRLARYARDNDAANVLSYDDPTAETHIELTASGLALIDTISGSGSGPANCALQIVAVHDGTNAPLVADTTARLTEPVPDNQS